MIGAGVPSFVIVLVAVIVTAAIVALAIKAIAAMRARTRIAKKD